MRRNELKIGLFCVFENVNPGFDPSHEEACHAAYITSTDSAERFQARNEPGPGKIARNHSQTENAHFKKGGTTTLSRDAREVAGFREAKYARL